MLASCHTQSGPRNKCGDKGFSLLEMSIVLVIVSTVAAGAIAYLAISMERRGLLETQQKLAAIQETLMNYRLAFNRLPCPADRNDAFGSADFGKEVNNDTGCVDALFVGSTNTEVRGGDVPVQTLGLPDDYAFDGWGRRMLYITTSVMAADNAFITNGPAAVVTGMMDVFDSSGAAKTDRAVYAVVSHGPNGYGATTRSGATVSFLNSNVGENANCGCGLMGVYSGFDEQIYQGVPTGDPASSNHFDDVVIYETRASMRSVQE